MSFLKRYYQVFVNYTENNLQNTITINIFSKSLYLFLLFKILIGWSVIQAIIEPRFPVPAIILPVFGVVLVLAGIFLRLNYFSGTIIFLYSFMLYRLTMPIVNGSDLVLNLFLFLSIFLAPAPAIRGLTETPQHIVNAIFLVCRVQLVLIYLLSGFDKLMSEAWRSGAAVFSIVNLEFYFNPLVAIELPKTAYAVIGWLIILFELAFGLLIWKRSFRVPLLILGFIFHLGIIFMMGLPDFGFIMILLYSLFIPWDKLLDNRFKPATSDGN